MDTKSLKDRELLVFTRKDGDRWASDFLVWCEEDHTLRLLNADGLWRQWLPSYLWPYLGPVWTTGLFVPPSIPLEGRETSPLTEFLGSQELWPMEGVNIPKLMDKVCLEKVGSLSSEDPKNPTRKLLKVFTSVQDASVNYVDPRGLEARYVRRTRERVIVYLSSQTGCRQGCAMCWLTTQGQRQDSDASLAEISAQASQVLAHYGAVTELEHLSAETALEALTKPAQEVHFNFMARGEPLASSVLRAWLPEIVEDLVGQAQRLGLPARVLISTILPRTARTLDLVEFVGSLPVDIYWSWYSSDPTFRKKWLPSAENPESGFDRMAALAQATGRPARIHFPLIAGENDGLANLESLLSALETRSLRAIVNLIHYNPPPGSNSTQASIGTYKTWRNSLLHAPLVEGVKILPPVGVDVWASCGMFPAD